MKPLVTLVRRDDPARGRAAALGVRVVLRADEATTTDRTHRNPTALKDRPGLFIPARGAATCHAEENEYDYGPSPRLRGSLFPDCHGVEPHDIWPLGQDFRVAVSGQDSLVSVSWNLTP